MTIPATIADMLTQGEMPAGMDVRPGFVRVGLADPRADMDGQTLDLQDRHGHTVQGWATRRFLRTLGAEPLLTWWTLPPGADRAICVEPVAWRATDNEETAS